jgi:hypothetical protein
VAAKESSEAEGQISGRTSVLLAGRPTVPHIYG